jgi:uncharacterized membrane protein (UPF0127 family)
MTGHGKAGRFSYILESMNHVPPSKNMKKVLYAFLALLSVIFISYTYQCGANKVCGGETVERIVRSGKEVTLPGGAVYAEIVDTPISRAKGLSGRRGLAPDEAMLFVFDYPGKYGFWMKDMLFPIDIVWISEDGTVVHIERNISPDTYSKQAPPQTFMNTPDAKYVLELASGQAERFGLYLGTKVLVGE